MNTTILDLLFLESPDTRNIFLQDVSSYNPDLEVENPLLEITPPGFSTSYQIIYPTLSIIPINSNALNLTSTSDYSKLVTMADGLWTIKQSISPNDCLYKVHTYFRIVNLKKQLLCYASEQLDLSNTNCTLTDDWYRDIFNLLQLLESAKYMAENCCDDKKATILYNYVKGQANKYSCSDCQ